MDAKKHYAKDYFEWQGNIGAFGGRANLHKFQDFISEEQTIVDFGSGGGYLLNNISCKEKIGIEINETARAQSAKLGIPVVGATNELKDNFADLIISNNALEHTTHPLDELKALYRILKPGGRIVFVVPCESISYAYKPNDINYHLYSWSPMCLGNLFTEAGFELIESKPYMHKWPPQYERIAKYFGWKVFHAIARIHARLARSWFQVRVVAAKPKT